MSSPNCRECKDKGYTEYFDLTGYTIYRWEKPKTKRCTCEAGIRYEGRCTDETFTKNRSLTK